MKHEKVVGGRQNLISEFFGIFYCYAKLFYLTKFKLPLLVHGANNYTLYIREICQLIHGRTGLTLF